MAIEIKTGVGRLVWGHPGKSKIKTDINTKLPKLNKEGKQIEQWAFGVAFPKNEFGAIWAAMSQEAASGYPQNIPAKFAWKYTDGDLNDHNGVPFANREGYRGCFILNISSEAFAPPIFKFINGAYVQLGADQIKCGDYVVVALNIKVNVPQQSTHTPGLYVNPVAIEHVAYGVEIQNSADPMALFGGQTQYALPQGASLAPIAPAHNVGMPGTNGPGQMPMQQPQQYQQPGQMPSAAPAPHYPTPGPGYTPPHNPAFTGGGQMPGGPAPMMTAPAPAPMQQPQYQQPGQMPGHVQPAHDFVHNAGQQYQQPQPMQPQQYQQPGQMPMHAPAPGPGQMPGMLPNR